MRLNLRGPSIKEAGERQPFIGAFPWPGDPFFRPTVGLFVEDRLTHTARTVRRRPDPAGPDQAWLCHYAFQQSPAPAGRSATVVCLETGNRVWPSAMVEDDRHPLTVDALVRLAQASRPGWDFSGFVSFIAMPIADQVALVYADLLSRHPDQDGFNGYCAALMSGRQTILDVRDTVAMSDEFLQRPRSSDEQVGQWLVWGGLNDLAAHLVAVPSLAQADMLRELTAEQRDASWVLGRPFSSAEEARSYLLSLALGTKPRREDVARWTSDHAHEVEAAVEVLLARPATRLNDAQRAPVLLKGLLPSLRPGPAGRRVDRSIATIPGQAGLVGSGFAPQTRRGRFVLRVRLTPTTGTTLPLAGEHLVLQVSYGDTMLAERRVEAPPTASQVELHYTISNDLAPLLSKPLLRVAILADGRFGFEITEIEILDCGEPDESTPATAAETDWRSRIRIGVAGEASSQAIVASKPKVAGHLFFGPYAHLLPGHYKLTVLATVTSTRRRRDRVTLEAVAGPTLLAAADMPVRSGANEFRLPFSVPPNVDATDPVEFRLWVPGTFAIAIDRIASRAM